MEILHHPLNRYQVRVVSALILMTFLATICVLFTSGVVRFVAALQLDLFLPGYACTLLTEPSPVVDLSIERIAKSLGLSMMFAVFAGIVVQYFPGGLSPTHIVLALLNVTVILALASLLRGRKTRVMVGTVTGIHRSRRWYTGFFAAISVMSVAFIIAYSVATFAGGQDDHTINTSLAITQIYRRSGQSLSFDIQVNNQESGSRDFRMVISVDDKERLRFNSPVLHVASSWSRVISLKSVPQGHQVKVDLFLKLGSKVPYRSVHFYT